jgi:hypothetical protein
MIVPFAAGGATDVLARSSASGCGPFSVQPIVVENVTGAGGSIGVTRLVRAPADGYTLEMGTSTTNMLLGGLYPLQFDLHRRSRAGPADRKRAADDRRQEGLPRQRPQGTDRLAQGPIPTRRRSAFRRSAAPGISPACHSLKEIGDDGAVHPYRGNGPALQDLVAGQIDLQIEPASNFFAQAKAGAIKPYAITSRNRSIGGRRHSDHRRGRDARLRGLAVVWAVGRRRTPERTSSRD